jgi:hypothetical protein
MLCRVPIVLLLTRPVSLKLLTLPTSSHPISSAADVGVRNGSMSGVTSPLKGVSARDRKDSASTITLNLQPPESERKSDQCVRPLPLESIRTGVTQADPGPCDSEAVLEKKTTSDDLGKEYPDDSLFQKVLNSQAVKGFSDRIVSKDKTYAEVVMNKKELVREIEEERRRQEIEQSSPRPSDKGRHHSDCGEGAVGVDSDGKSDGNVMPNSNSLFLSPFSSPCKANGQGTFSPSSSYDSDSSSPSPVGSCGSNGSAGALCCSSNSSPERKSKSDSNSNSSDIQGGDGDAINTIDVKANGSSSNSSSDFNGKGGASSSKGSVSGHGNESPVKKSSRSPTGSNQYYSDNTSSGEIKEEIEVDLGLEEESQQERRKSLKSNSVSITKLNLATPPKAVLPPKTSSTLLNKITTIIHNDHSGSTVNTLFSVLSLASSPSLQGNNTAHSSTHTTSHTTSHSTTHTTSHSTTHSTTHSSTHSSSHSTTQTITSPSITHSNDDTPFSNTYSTSKLTDDNKNYYYNNIHNNYKPNGTASSSSMSSKSQSSSSGNLQKLSHNHSHGSKVKRHGSLNSISNYGGSHFTGNNSPLKSKMKNPLNGSRHSTGQQLTESVSSLFENDLLHSDDLYNQYSVKIRTFSEVRRLYYTTLSHLVSFVFSSCRLLTAYRNAALHDSHV